MARASAKRALARADRYLSIGASSQRSGDLADAESNYRRALEACADHAPSMHSLALLLHGRGKRAEAIALLERVIELEHSATALNNLANLLSEAGRAGEAVRHYRRALVLDDANVSARFNLAKALQSTGDPQGAVTELRLLAAREPDDAGVHAALGAALLDAGDANEAARALDRALAIDPVHADALNELGLVHLDRGAFELAADCFRQALDVEPGMAVACVNLVKTRRFGDGDSDAQDLGRVQAMLDRPGLSPAAEVDLRFAMGKALDDRGDYAKAFEHSGRGNALARRGIQFDGGEPLRRAEATARVFTREFIEGRARWGDASEVPVFIVGMPRSGTSLVEQILASHPQAAGAGELPEVPRFADAMRGVLGAEGGYPERAAELDVGSIESFAQGYLQRLRETDSNAARVSDKMPANCWHLGLIALALPNARVIHCQRDPMDTALSIFFRRFTRGHPYAYALADIAAELRGYERVMTHWREQLPLRMLELSYEDLVGDLESGTQALLDFLDLPFDERCLRFHDTERLVHTASAWQVRQPLYSSAVGRWRHYAEQLEPLRRALAQVAN